MNLKNGILVLACIFCLNLVSAAQDEEKEEKAGFKKEGTLREASFRNGKYHNKIMMAILDTEWNN